MLAVRLVYPVLLLHAAVLEGLPVMGELIRTSGAGTCAYLVSDLPAAGVPLDSALKDSAQCCGNTELEETLAGAAKGLRLEADRRTELLITVEPILVYLAAGTLVAWVVVTTITSIYSAIWIRCTV